MKLIVFEPETPALLARLSERTQTVSSALARVETLRAIRRAGGSRSDRRRAEEVLTRIALIRVDEPILVRAADLPPADLRSLDALHIATALSIGPDLSALITYDRRQADAASALGLDVATPR